MFKTSCLKVLCCSVLASLCIFGCDGTVNSQQRDIENACTHNIGVYQQGQCVCDDGSAISGEEALSLWTDDAAAKQALIAYMKQITQPGEKFIPIADRVAVFDLDGTLLFETDPNYLDYNIYVYRVLEDPAYKDLATPEQIDVANKIVQVNETGIVPEGLDVAHQIAYMEVFSGMTLPEYNRYVQDFIAQPAPGYNGMKRGEAYYQPMLQVIRYLQANWFTVYIVSGTDRLQVRSAISGIIDIPAHQVIGSDGTIVATGQPQSDNLNYDNLSYVYKKDDKLIRGGGFIVKNLKMNKVAVIAQEIGKQPVLSFGNSTGDASMAEYVISNNPYPSKAFMLLADDLERENGNQAKADKMAKLCNENGWVPISMKNDWKTIYGEGVTRKK